MTEDEAKTKWCPFTRAGNEAGCNRSEGALTQCIASDCMMWEQWPEYKDGKLLRDSEGKWIASDSGDCGLKSKDLEVSL